MMEHEIQAFGHRLGLESLSLSHDGLARLDIEGLGSFHLELSQKGGRRELLAYLAIPVEPVREAETARRLLALCDWRNGLPMPLSCGVFSGRAIVLTRMDESKVSAAGLENALRFLAEAAYSG